MSVLQRWTVAALLVTVAYRTIGAWTWVVLALLLAAALALLACVLALGLSLVWHKDPR